MIIQLKLPGGWSSCYPGYPFELFNSIILKNFAANLQNGYFKTKDVGYIDADGFLFILGRNDDAINRSGNYSPCRD